MEFDKPVEALRNGEDFQDIRAAGYSYTKPILVCVAYSEARHLLTVLKVGPYCFSGLSLAIVLLYPLQDRQQSTVACQARRSGDVEQPGLSNIPLWQLLKELETAGLPH